MLYSSLCYPQTSPFKHEHVASTVYLLSQHIIFLNSRNSSGFHKIFLLNFLALLSFLLINTETSHLGPSFESSFSWSNCTCGSSLLGYLISLGINLKFYFMHLKCLRLYFVFLIVYLFAFDLHGLLISFLIIWEDLFHYHDFKKAKNPKPWIITQMIWIRIFKAD